MKGVNGILKLVNNLWFCTGLVFVYVWVSFLTRENFQEAGHKIVLLGAEYATIAQSILQGDGYANPFEYETGPTAWMPPALVFLHVLVLKVFGMSYKAYMVLSFFRLSGYVATFYFLTKAKELTKMPVSNFILALVFVFYLRNGGFEILLLSMEHWVFLLLGALLLFGFIRFFKQGKGVGMLAVLFFLVPASAAALFIPQAVFLAFLFFLFMWQKWRGQGSLSAKVQFWHFVLFGAMAFLSVSVWTYRNYKTFDRVIVSKPNTWFEFYLANIKDDKGGLHKSTFINYHPLFNKDLCDEMLELGEANWLAPYADSARIYKQTHKKAYHKKVMYRAGNIFVFQQKMDDRQKVTAVDLLDSADVHHMLNNRLISGNLAERQMNWDILQISVDSAHTLLKSMPLVYAELWFDDFKKAKGKYEYYSISERFYRFAVAGLPMGCLIILVLAYWKKERLTMCLLGGMYLVFFIPFILVSFTTRYQLFVLEIQALIVAASFTYLLRRLWTPIAHQLEVERSE